MDGYAKKSQYNPQPKNLNNMKGKTITKETAKTKEEIALVLFAHKTWDFRKFTALAEEMLEKYVKTKNI